MAHGPLLAKSGRLGFTSLLLLLLAARASAAAGPQGYYRFPALHGDTVVFTAEGDLWRVPVKGGLAQRLTTHPGTEAYAAIAPDGRTVAFAAEYEGPTEVYTMPLDGGLPARLTYDAGDAVVVGWTPDGRILYRTRAFSTLPNAQLVRVDPQDGGREVLPLSQASDGVVVPGSGVLVFTRLPAQGSSTKRYQGGTVQNLWRFEPEATEAVPLSLDFRGTSYNPMWWKGRIYCLSDRDGVMNLWSLKPDGTDWKPLTRHQDYDVRHASLHNGRVVYQQGADLWLCDVSRPEPRRIQITLATDFDQKRERWIKKPLEYLTSAHVSPEGDRVALTARGQVFVAPAKTGRLVEIPRPAEVRYRHARFLPEGKSLVALSDETGELEFARLAADGLKPAERLTSDGDVFRFEGVPSPDGQWLAWGDKRQRLWVTSLTNPAPRWVAESLVDEITEFAWAPDSRWLAYTATATNTFRQIHLWNVADGTRVTVTSDRVESYSPAWSPDGLWLYFLSDREIRSLVPSPWGARQPDPFFTETTRLYHVALTNGLRSPFRPKDELLAADTSKPQKEEKPTPAAPEGVPPAEKKTPPGKPGTNVVVQLHPVGLPERVEQLPVPAGNYTRLAVTAKHLLWLARDTGFGARQNLRQLEISADGPTAKTLVEDVQSYELSGNGRKLLVRKGDQLHIVAVDAAAPARLDDTRVNLDGWSFALSPAEEWRQIFRESWRMIRDFFYDRGMHGVDWPAIRDKYQPLVARVSDRAELSDLLSGMIGELSALHLFVRYGDEREGPDSVAVGSLGARLQRDPAAGGWRIEQVYRTDPDYPADLAPLRQPGVDVRPGEILVRINGRDTLTAPHPAVLLRNQAGRQVLLEVRADPQAEPRQVIVNPVTAQKDAELRYAEWEYTRRLRVEELGDGQIGYVHLRAMGTDNIAEWARHYYPVFQRQGLILDVRSNRGGNIDSWILGKLLRKVWFYWQPRVGQPYWNMQYAFRGHLVVLCNEHTASDGEAFSEGFRRLGLGLVIGTRTWGGEIWLSAQRWLVDNGMATAAETGVYGPEGAWLIEGRGVEPDVVVDNLPHATFQGEDAQLDAGVRHLLEQIAKDPRPVPPPPKYPDKAFRP